MIRIGAIASVEAAESFAQNRPCGLENELMKAVSGAASVVVSVLTVAWAVRVLRRVPPAALLRGAPTAEGQAGSTGRTRWGLAVAVLSAVGAAVLVAVSGLVQDAQARAMTFFGGGALLLVAGLAALFAWLASWNDLVYAIYLFLGERTLPLMTFYYSNRGSVFDTATFAVLLTIPVMLVTLALQRYVESGTLSGAIKG